MEGIYPIYKPIGITSHDVIFKLRQATHIQRIGHAGTLDPLAEGVLVVAIGRQYTKQLTQLILKDKEYFASVTLGAFSSTDDSEGEKTIVKTDITPSYTRVSQYIQSFKGEVDLRPPAFSAIKIHGKRAYTIARKGKLVELEKRKCRIFEIELINYFWPHLCFRVVTGSGVYVRSIARALGEMLGCGGYIEKLERTRVGGFTKEQSIPLIDFIKTIRKTT